MKIKLKCFSKLTDPEKCDYRESTSYDISEGQTVEDLLGQVGIDKKNVKVAFLNSKIASFNTVLSDGDQIGLAPPVGGM